MSVITAHASGYPLSRHLRLACRLLLLTTALLLIGGTYELVRAFPESAPVPPTPDRGFLEVTAGLQLPRVENTIDMYGRRRIFGRPPDPKGVGEDPGGQPVPLQGWRVVVRDHFRLMGISIVQQPMADGTRQPVREAIVLDSRGGNMHFLAAGNNLVINDNHVNVRSVLADAVVLESDDAELTLRTQGATE